MRSNTFYVRFLNSVVIFWKTQRKKYVPLQSFRATTMVKRYDFDPTNYLSGSNPARSVSNELFSDARILAESGLVACNRFVQWRENRASQGLRPYSR